MVFDIKIQKKKIFVCYICSILLIESVRFAFVDQISKSKYEVFDGVSKSTVVFDEKAIHHAMKVALGSNICGNDF